MKKALSLILAISLALSLCLVFTGCVETGTSSITYGEKYSYEKYSPDSEYYDYITDTTYSIIEDKKISITLSDDNTGKYEYYYEITYEEGSPKAEESYVISGTINFDWVETSNGSIHLFETKKTYDKKSTEGKEFDLPASPIFYSEDMIYFEGENSKKFIREDSDLYDTVYGTDEDAE